MHLNSYLKESEKDLEIVSQSKLHDARFALGCGEFTETDGHASKVRNVPDPTLGERSGKHGRVGYVEDVPSQAEFMVLSPRHRELFLQSHIHGEVIRHAQ